jgi:hypothetical protein
MDKENIIKNKKTVQTGRIEPAPSALITSPLNSLDRGLKKTSKS